MKVISKEDLILVISLINNRNDFDLDDFEEILDRFGDDYFIHDGMFQKIHENKEMNRIRAKGKEIKK